MVLARPTFPGQNKMAAGSGGRNETNCIEVLQWAESISGAAMLEDNLTCKCMCERRLMCFLLREKRLW